MIGWRILPYRVRPGHVAHNGVSYSRATRGTATRGPRPCAAPPHPAAPSYPARQRNAARQPPAVPAHRLSPSRSSGWWPSLGDEDVSSPESSRSSDLIAFPSLASAPDQHGATRATTRPDPWLIAETLATTCRDAAKIDHRRRPPNRHLGDCVRSWLHPGWWPDLTSDLSGCVSR